MLGSKNQILPSLTLQTHPPPSGGISFPFFVSTKKSGDNDFATFEGHFQTIFQDLERTRPCGDVAHALHIEMGMRMVGWLVVWWVS